MCSTGATSQPGSGIGEPVEEAAAGERRDHCGKETSGIIVRRKTGSRASRATHQVGDIFIPSFGENLRGIRRGQGTWI